MAHKDPRVDAYIAKSAAFAQPILKSLREQIHAACPDVTETIKWSMPFFDWQGPLCNIAAFKAHCAFGFWKGQLVVDAGVIDDSAMGQFGRITALSELPPPSVIAACIEKAMTLNQPQVKAPRAMRTLKPPLAVPADLQAGLQANAAARRAFAGFSSSQQREYIEWLLDAKTAATRSKRLATTLEWVAEGKTRNWKYQNC